MRYENLHIDASAYVGSRGLPTVLNSYINFFEGILLYLHLLRGAKAPFTILDNQSGVRAPGVQSSAMTCATAAAAAVGDTSAACCCSCCCSTLSCLLHLLNTAPELHVGGQAVADVPAARPAQLWQDLAPEGAGRQVPRQQGAGGAWAQMQLLCLL